MFVNRENESEDDEEEDDDDEESESSQGESADENEVAKVESENKFIIEKMSSLEKAMSSLGTETPSIDSKIMNLLKNVTAADFLQYPSPERFLALEKNKTEEILNEVKVCG